MNHLLRMALPLLGSALLASPACAAAARGSAQAAEAVRTADAVWAQAAGTGNVDAWKAFYANDAIVLLPHEPLVSGADQARPLVTRLLQRSHLLVTWRAARLEVAGTGELAYMTGEYTLAFDDAGGRALAERGRRTEIWRLQNDGTWRCSVDTWSSDEPSAPPPAKMGPAAEPGVAAPHATSPPDSSKYGQRPVHYEQAVRAYFQARRTDPDSIRSITSPQQGYVTEITGTVLMRETRRYGWIVRASVPVSDTQTGRAASETYTFLFRGEEIVATRSGLPTS